LPHNDRMDDLVTRLMQTLPAGAVLSGAQIGDKYSVDYTAENAQQPLAVVRPSSADELATIMRACSSASQRVVVQGGLTGLAGGATPIAGEIAISLERMSGVIEVDTVGMTLSAWAGTPLQVVQQAAADAGCLFPLDFGARGSCHIGGAIATNAGGNQVIRFGMARNLVLGLEVVLADGTILDSMHKMLKNNAGYDLKQLFIGTEGTLGIVTRCVLRLFPLLPSRGTALCALKSFADLTELLSIARHRLATSLSAFEVMWASYFDYVTDHVDGARSPFDDRHPLYALIQLEGMDAQADAQALEGFLEEAAEAGCIEDAVIAQSESQRDRLWAIRDGIAEITRPLTPYASLDVRLPIHSMPAYLDDVERELRAAFADIRILVFGHIADNNLHLFITTGRADDLHGIHAIAYRITGHHAGSVSAEHGIGRLKTPYLHYSRGAEEMAVMGRLKQALDPLGIVNAGRVLSDSDERR